MKTDAENRDDSGVGGVGEENRQTCCSEEFGSGKVVRDSTPKRVSPPGAMKPKAVPRARQLNKCTWLPKPGSPRAPTGSARKRNLAGASATPRTPATQER